LNTLRKGQLSEALYGSTELLAKAMGITEKELFKQMEAGKVIAAEVLPKLAKEYRKAAMDNGAFGAASKKTRAELNRFLAELSLIKNAIFTGGFGEGLAYAFKGMADFLQASKGAASVLGVFLKGALATVTLPFELLGVLIKGISLQFGETEKSVINFTAALMGSVAAVMAFFKAWALVKGIFGTVGKVKDVIKSTATSGTASAGMSTLGKANVIGTLATAGYNIYDYLANTLPQGLQTGGKEMELIRSGAMSRGVNWGSQPQTIEVMVRDGKVEGLIEAKVMQSNTENLTSILASGTR
jgi:hypothetical protein